MPNLRRSLLVIHLRLAVASGAALAVASAAPVAVAADVESEISSAESAFAQVNYDDAIKRAEAAIKTGGLTHDQLRRAYKVVALARAGSDQSDKAREAFIQLLTVDPDFSLDSGFGPKIQQPFLEARGFWRGQSSRPGIDLAPALRETGSGRMRVTLHDPTHVVAKAIVAFRWGTASPFRRVDVTVGDHLLTIPEAPSGVTRFDYYAQAFDEKNDVVFETGNEAVPKTAIVEVASRGPVSGGAPPKKEEGGTIFSSPVFWIVAGVVVAGGVTTGVLLASHKTNTREEQLPPTNANVGPILFCGTERCR